MKALHPLSIRLSICPARGIENVPENVAAGSFLVRATLWTFLGNVGCFKMFFLPSPAWCPPAHKMSP